jgi:cytoskeletal protein CcmA (bactofilin family)
MAQPTPAPTTPPVPASNVSPLPSATKPPSELNALLGKGSQFEGKLIFEGTVRIDGKFSGEILSTDTLIIGEGAEVKANLTVGALVCLGDYAGDAKATKSIELKAPAKVRGNLSTASVVIERGVFFDGTCKMDTNGNASAVPKK